MGAQDIIKVQKVIQVDPEVVQTLVGILGKLLSTKIKNAILPVDEGLLLSCLQDEVHELESCCVSLVSLGSVLVFLVLVVTQILVCVVDRWSVETHLRYFDLEIYNIAH